MKKILKIAWESLKELGRTLLKIILYIAVILGAVALLGIFRMRSLDRNTDVEYIATVEYNLEEKIQALDYRIDELRDEIENRLEEMETDQEIRTGELKDETEWILDRLNEAEESLAETAGTTEYILELIEEYHPE